MLWTTGHSGESDNIGDSGDLGESGEYGGFVELVTGGYLENLAILVILVNLVDLEVWLNLKSG